MGRSNFDCRCYDCVCYLNIHASEELPQASATTVSNVLLFAKIQMGAGEVRKTIEPSAILMIVPAASERHLHRKGPVSYNLVFLLRMLTVSLH